MKLEVEPQSYVLKKPLAIGERVLGHREVLIVRLHDGEYVGEGEVAPLPGFSEERLEDCREFLEAMRLPTSLEYLHVPFPSVQFALEQAWFDLEAQRRGCPMRFLWHSSPARTLRVNALAHYGDSAPKRPVLKLKVGRGPLEDEIAWVDHVRQQAGPGVQLRIDANRSWNLNTALIFARAVWSHQIEYIEEPLKDPSQLEDFYQMTGLPIALDETLRDLGTFHPFDGLRSIILKPTLQGGIQKCLYLAAKARMFQVLPIISSSYEGPLGMRALAQLASVVTPEPVAVGLDTLSNFQDVEFPLKGGKIQMRDLDPSA